MAQTNETHTDKPQQRTIEILAGISPEKYARSKDRNVSAYDMVGVSSSNHHNANPLEAEVEIKRQALEKGCEVILNVDPKVVYDRGFYSLRVYLAGIGLKLKDNPP